MKKVLNTDINKLNWRFNKIFFSDHKPGHLLYGRGHETMVMVAKVKLRLVDRDW